MHDISHYKTLDFYYIKVNAANTWVKEEPKLWDLIRMKMDKMKFSGSNNACMSVTSQMCVTSFCKANRDAFYELGHYYQVHTTQEEKEELKRFAQLAKSDPTHPEVVEMRNAFKKHYCY